MEFFLPTSRKELQAHGWNNVDIILFTGDAYIDHPSFGIAVIGRVLEAQGYRVAVVPQPNWQDDLRDFKKLGAPRLFFGVSSGNMDSMVNHYTAGKRLRSRDAYTPDGRAGARPHRAVTVYTQILKSLYPHIPVVIGGIEASLRRLGHYDYWEDKWSASVLVESGADYLVYGMGERAITELAYKIRKRASIQEVQKTPQIAWVDEGTGGQAWGKEAIVLHSFETCVRSKEACIENFNVIEREANATTAKVLVEPVLDRYVVVNPPFPLMASHELDAIYNLPFTRLPHPRYRGKHIPAYEMVKHSITLHRGCFGGCSFCTIAAHQGRHIVSRSRESVLTEVKALVAHPEFKGVISDLGGPSANMYGMGGINRELCNTCVHTSCLFPKICKNLDHNHTSLTELYQAVRGVQGVRHAFVGSGIRYDLFLDPHGFTSREGQYYFEELVRHHISGRLKVAPEHTQDNVLNYMEKPSFRLFERLQECFERVNAIENLKLQLVPYFISAHPGCTERDMEALSQKLHRRKVSVEQVQDFTPTPMTRSSVMFYTKNDLQTGKEIFVERDNMLKKRQKTYFFQKKV